MKHNPYKIVEMFEEEVAEYTGSPYAIALDNCTDALFLCCVYSKVTEVTIPKKTYLSVPQAIMSSGGKVIFDDTEWKGLYELKPYNIDVNAVAPGALATRLVDQVLNAGPDVVGSEFYDKNLAWKTKGATSPELGAELVYYLAGAKSNGITGRLLSAQWDNWKDLSSHLNELNTSDIYCLRRIVPEDRKKDWN